MTCTEKSLDILNFTLCKLFRYRLLFYEAHYLSSIAVQHFLITSPDEKTVSESPNYLNPGWPIEVGATCK